MYILGIYIPVMDLMFVILIFMFVLMAINWLELRKLRLLILTEQADIYRLEKDLSMIEPKGKQPIQTLEQYVSLLQKKGIIRKEIEKICINKGWSKTKIDEIFAKLQKPK